MGMKMLGIKKDRFVCLLIKTRCANFAITAGLDGKLPGFL